MRVGIIGCGHRIQGVLSLIDRLNAGVVLAAVADIRNDEVAREIAGRPEASDVRYYTDPDEMLDLERLDGVMVGTRCSLHSTMAQKVLARNLPMYLEKPIATNMADLVALRDAAVSSTSDVVVSFPLRVTPLVQVAKEILDSGQIGTVEHVQAWNNVPYGWIYYQGWYRDENETQGLFLQKATHDFDYIYYLVRQQPVEVCAMTSKRIYKGDHPAGLRCDDCDEQDECLESPFHLYYTKNEKSAVEPSGLMCGFAVDTGNEDSGSAIVRFESGSHACYSQNFFARKSAGRRGASFFGYRGTVEFDWYTNEVRVHMHHTPRTQIHKVDTSNASHGGGDTVLADNFLRVMRGEQQSVSPLSAGLLSVLTCLKAKQSAQTHTFQQIKYPDEP